MLHLRDGIWNGAEFVPTEDDDEGEGYGYQLWLTGNGGYRASGMFGQDVFVLPHLDAVIVTTGSIAHGLHRYLSGLVHEHLVPALDPAGSPENDARLVEKLTATGIAPELPSTRPAVRVDGARFTCAANEDALTEIAFVESDGELSVRLTDTRGTHLVRCGLSTWVEASTTVTCWQLHHSYQPETMRVLAGARWETPRLLVLEWYFVESPFHDTVRIEFPVDDQLRWTRGVNVNSTETLRPVVTGKRRTA